MSTGPFILPVGDVYVPCTWGCHTDRTPPSTEAGTDYASSYGTTVYAPANGVVHDLKTDNSGAMGRVVFIENDDGSWIRSLHMSSIAVKKGQRLTAGKTVLGKSGASGYGDDWYYGPHLHESLWTSRSSMPYPGSTPTQDFENYVGDPTPPEDDVKINNIGVGFKGSQKVGPGRDKGEYLHKEEDGNTRVATGPSLHITGTLNISFKGLREGEVAEVRPMKATEKNGVWTDSSLGGHEFYGVAKSDDDIYLVKVSVDTSLNDDQILRFMVYGQNAEIIIDGAYFRGAEFVAA